jgi:RNA polymerase sigma factor (sigma-70 family)
MADPWEVYLGKFADTLARPGRTWSEAETAKVWNSLATGPVGQYLYGCAFRGVRNHAIAEEIVQKLLAELSLSRTYDPGEGGPEKFRVWVHACLHNHLTRHFAAQSRERKYLGTPIDPDKIDTVAGTGAKQGILKVEAEIAAQSMLRVLSPRRRDVMTRSLRGESHEEIARALGLTQGNVRQLLFRARRDLHKSFGISLPISS